MLKSRKHVFWEALIMTIAIFIIGLFLGMLVETGNSEKVSQLYIQSEINLVDGLAVSMLSEGSNLDCDSIKQNNIEFANKVYEEALQLEEYEEAGTLTKSMKLLHKKYDLLRTLIWMSNQESFERCNNYHLVVYLYDYDTEDNQIKAEQNVWSKRLLDLKNEREDLMLLPVAGNQNITSLDLLMEEHQVEKLPAVIINNKDIIYEVEDSSRLESLLE